MRLSQIIVQRNCCDYHKVKTPSAAHTTVTFDTSGMRQIIVRKTQNYLNKQSVFKISLVCLCGENSVHSSPVCRVYTPFKPISHKFCTVLYTVCQLQAQPLIVDYPVNCICSKFTLTTNICYSHY